MKTVTLTETAPGFDDGNNNNNNNWEKPANKETAVVVSPNENQQNTPGDSQNNKPPVMPQRSGESAGRFPRALATNGVRNTIESISLFCIFSWFLIFYCIFNLRNWTAGSSDAAAATTATASIGAENVGKYSGIEQPAAAAWNQTD